MSGRYLSSETHHASTVAVDGRAVLITGPSGSGKSDLALRLLDRGFTLVSDDQTIVRRDYGTLDADVHHRVADRMSRFHIQILKRRAAYLDDTIVGFVHAD